MLLTDFGIAKGLDGADDDLTSDNVMMGTAKYLSPEQVRGRKLDGRADLYSLGLVLYECLAGRVPFLGETDADTALARLQRDPTDLARLRPDAAARPGQPDPPLARPQPGHRPATGAELRAALQRIAGRRDPARDRRHRARRTTPSARRAPPVTDGGAAHRRRGPRASTADGTTPHPWRRHNHRHRGRPRPPRVAVRGRQSVGVVAVGDHTPPTLDVIRRAQPARGLQQRWTPRWWWWVGLLVIAAVVGGILWMMLGTGGDDTGLPRPRCCPATSQPAPPSRDATGVTDPAAVVEAPVPIEIAGIAAWDPDGTNGSENDAQAPLALADGSGATSWSTECYSSQYMGGKSGVGLIVTLLARSPGHLRVESVNAPYALQVFASTDATPPTALAGMGEPLADKAFADVAGVIETTVSTPASHLLIWLTEVGRDSGCSTANPYRGGWPRSRSRA